MKMLRFALLALLLAGMVAGFSDLYRNVTIADGSDPFPCDRTHGVVCPPSVKP